MTARVRVAFASSYDLPAALSLHAARAAELSHVEAVSPHQAYASNFTRPEELRIDLLVDQQVFERFRRVKRPYSKTFSSCQSA